MVKWVALVVGGSSGVFLALVTIASSGPGFYLCAAMALSACSLVGHPYGVIAWRPVLAGVHSMCQYPLISTGRPGTSSAHSL